MINGTACYLKRGEHTLFLYRHKGESDIHNGLYVPPGGVTEPGERGIDCVVREFKEETGLTLFNPRLKIIATHYNFGRKLGDKLNPEDWCVEYYICKEFSGKLKEETPNAKPIWILNRNISSLKMHEGDKKMLDLLDNAGVYQLLTQYSGEKLTRFDYCSVD